MFSGSVTLKGGDGAIVWGYRTAATITSWTCGRSQQGTWTLRATVQRADPFLLKQRPLMFTAPRVGGRFAWPVVAVTVAALSLSAQLGPPES